MPCNLFTWLSQVFYHKTFICAFEIGLVSGYETNAFSMHGFVFEASAATSFLSDPTRLGIQHKKYLKALFKNLEYEFIEYPYSIVANKALKAPGTKAGRFIQRKELFPIGKYPRSSVSFRKSHQI
ncbi:hypothetical protein AVEN_85900-1 [Araneus ventricosus]|uniref:Uncharacterized protein n=1 Tax=Araneus ventricosus TaxID=182803 RepID=A0A4Y2LTA8_ARAVE|nr:hypothetical protein AVEN_85900-1 [Araneus ventricosus]